jgi:hypothetical protein
VRSIAGWGAIVRTWATDQGTRSPAIGHFLSSCRLLEATSANDHRSCGIVRRCRVPCFWTSGLGACHHPPGWFHFHISSILSHVFPSITVCISCEGQLLTLLFFFFRNCLFIFIIAFLNLSVNYNLAIKRS